MRKSFITLIAAFISSIAICQTSMPVDSVAARIGDRVTVCAKVYGVKSLEKVTLINVGAPYPNSPLTIVIFAKDKGNFKDIESTYDDKNICVIGMVKEYKGKPEIIVTTPHDITVQ